MGTMMPLQSSLSLADPVPLESSHSHYRMLVAALPLPVTAELASAAVTTLPSHPPPPPSSSSSPSFNVTFKVLRLLHVIRQRVKTRVASSSPKRTSPEQLADGFCRDFERQATDKVDRYLDSKTSYFQFDRREPSLGRSASNVALLDRPDQPKEEGSAAANNIKWLLSQLDLFATVDDLALTRIATDDRLFLKRATDFNINSLSLRELVPAVIVVRNLLDSLTRIHPPQSSAVALFDDRRIIVNDPDLDLKFIANLIHLLLCLQDRLWRLLITRCVELVRSHIIECQRDHDKTCKDWFFEYPDARHPLNTTWPWGIKPSLAVLWGVCWMFYGFANQYFDIDLQGNIISIANPAGIILPYQHARAFLQQQAGQAQGLTANTMQVESIHSLGWPNNGGMQDMNMVSTVEQGLTFDGNLDPWSAGEAYEPTIANATPLRETQPRNLDQAAMPQLHPPPIPLVTPPRDESFPVLHHHHCLSRPSTHATNAADQAADAYANIGGLRTNRRLGASTATAPALATYPQFSASVSAIPDATASNREWLPEENLNSYHHQYQQHNQQIGLSDQDNASPYSADGSLHCHGNTYAQFTPLPGLSPHAHPSPLSQRVDIRLHTDPNTLQGYSNYQPQEPHISPAISSALSDRSNPNYLRPSMATQPPSESPSVAGHLDFKGPVSPISQNRQNDQQSPVPSQNGDSMSRKRSWDDMSRDPIPHSGLSSHEDANPPSAISSNNGIDEYPGVRGSRTHKRVNAPTNPEGKYFCNVSQECQSILFDRKCEWSKHMDKHDRPYRCVHAQCAKLQGFTYSGGLLRHEREVHGKHGGPKETLRCPYPECKRHSGKGFTRKENLTEHVRRVHSKDEASPSIKRDVAMAMAADATSGMMSVDTPGSRYSENLAGEEDLATSPEGLAGLTNKRRKYMPGVADMGEHGASEDVEELRDEVRRLRSETLAKDEKILHLENRYSQVLEALHGLEAKIQTT